jgi:hypothetical protein
MCPTPSEVVARLAGGLFTAAAMELAKKLLALYLGKVPTYSAVYGTFATVPILLVWIYLVWVIVLLGAVIAAYLPSLLAGVARRGGWARAGSSSWRWRCCSAGGARAPRVRRYKKCSNLRTGCGPSRCPCTSPSRP